MAFYKHDQNLGIQTISAKCFQKQAIVCSTPWLVKLSEFLVLDAHFLQVHFDEATITVTADLGESAARFRSLFRKKRGLATLPCHRFGESKTITVHHEEEEDEIPSPQLDRKEKNKSIFEVCNYSAYGRYT